MNKIVGFVKRNWISLFLVVVVLFLLGVKTPSRWTPKFGSDSTSSLGGVAAPLVMMDSIEFSSSNSDFVETADRMVSQDTKLSMLVKDVTVSMKAIEEKANLAGGYMVNRNISKSEGADNGFVSVRVPTKNLEEVLESYKALSVRVVSESVKGKDVTDQYTNIEERLASLEKTKAKMNSLLDSAVLVKDIMEIQKQLGSIQQQIDNLVGRKKYIEQTVDFSLISMNLSTDELSLPYTPDGSWRPEVIFKTAVRSLLGTLRSLGGLAIWIVVFSPLWGAVLAAVLIVKKKKSRAV